MRIRWMRAVFCCRDNISARLFQKKKKNGSTINMFDIIVFRRQPNRHTCHSKLEINSEDGINLVCSSFKWFFFCLHSIGTCLLRCVQKSGIKTKDNTFFSRNVQADTRVSVLRERKEQIHLILCHEAFASFQITRITLYFYLGNLRKPCICLHFSNLLSQWIHGLHKHFQHKNRQKCHGDERIWFCFFFLPPFRLRGRTK